MKKTLSVLLLVCLLILPVSASATADPVPTPPAAETDPLPIDDLRLPLTALTLAILENDLTYDSSSSHFIWTALYYGLSLCGPEDEGTLITEEQLLLPAQCVQPLFSTLFACRRELPSIPGELAEQIRCNADTGLYELALGDPALVATDVTTATLVWTGLRVLEGTVTDPDSGSVLCTFRALLKEQTGTSGFSVLDFIVSH